MSLVTPTVAPTLAPTFDTEIGGGVECFRGCICCAFSAQNTFRDRRVVINGSELAPKPHRSCIGKIFSRICCCCGSEKPKMAKQRDYHAYLSERYGEDVAGVVEDYLKLQGSKALKVKHVLDGEEFAAKTQELKGIVKRMKFNLDLENVDAPDDEISVNEDVVPLDVSLRVVKGSREEAFDEEKIRRDLESMEVGEAAILHILPRIKARILSQGDGSESLTPRAIRSIVAGELKGEHIAISPSPLLDTLRQSGDRDLLQIVERKEAFEMTADELIRLDKCLGRSGLRECYDSADTASHKSDSDSGSSSDF